MERIKITLLILLVIFAINCMAAVQTNDKTQGPNVVLIIADDVSPDFTCFNGQVHTPNIDQLAGNGVRFENAYVTASSCSPSRNSIITGRYPHNTGAPELHMDLPEGQFMFPKAMTDAGYYCVLSGKWHMGNATRPAFDLIIHEGYAKDPTGSARWIQCLQERPKDKPFGRTRRMI